MSLRIDSAEWISGALIIGETGFGVLGSAIPSTGDNGPGYAYNDLSLPADNTKEICGRITTWPTLGTLTAFEDTSFEFTGPDGSHSFQYQLYVDGVATGSPVTVSLSVGAVSATASGTLAALGLTAPTGTATGTTNATAVGTLATISLSAPLGYAVGTEAGSAVGIGGFVSVVLSAPEGTAVGTTGGTWSGSISDEDIARIVAAVLAALQATAIPVDAKKMNGAPITGDGSVLNPWRGVGVSP